MSPEFYTKAYLFDQTVWSLPCSFGLANLGVDQKIHRNRSYYLEADIRRLWATWFLEGIIDPYIILEKNPSPVLLEIIAEVERCLASTFNMPTNIAWPDIRLSISSAILARVEQIKNFSARKNFTQKERTILLAAAGSHPRCWICGDAFSAEAIAIFSGKSAATIHLPIYIDVLRPKGTKERHLKIEIDHVFPISRGGVHDITNFKLCCGWCNIHKKDRTSLYDVGGRPIKLKEGKITKTTKFRTIPQHFWSVRVLGLTRRCEHDSCPATTENESLFISFIELSGSATPSNLSVVCKNHDPLTKSRMQLARDVVASLK